MKFQSRKLFFRFLHCIIHFTYNDSCYFCKVIVYNEDRLDLTESLAREQILWIQNAFYNATSSFRFFSFRSDIFVFIYFYLLIKFERSFLFHLVQKAINLYNFVKPNVKLYYTDTIQYNKFITLRNEYHSCESIFNNIPSYNIINSSFLGHPYICIDETCNIIIFSYTIKSTTKLTTHFQQLLLVSECFRMGLAKNIKFYLSNAIELFYMSLDVKNNYYN